MIALSEHQQDTGDFIRIKIQLHCFIRQSESLHNEHVSRNGKQVSAYR